MNKVFLKYNLHAVYMLLWYVWYDIHVSLSYGRVKSFRKHGTQNKHILVMLKSSVAQCLRGYLHSTSWKDTTPKALTTPFQ